MSIPPSSSSASHSTSTSATSSSASGASTCRLMERTWSRHASKYGEEVVGYGSSLECALEHARTEALRFQQEALDSRNQSALAVHYLALQAHTLAADKAQALEDTRRCKEQLRSAQASLAEEQIRAKNLESQIVELKLAVRKKDELLEEHKSKGRSAQKALRKQNETLLRKATLSWILACLSNPYIEAETSKERTASLMMMAQDLLQSDSQSPVAAQSSCTFSNMKAKSLRLECAYVENEIKHMLHISNSSSQSLSEDCDSFEIPSRTSELSTTRSLKDEGTALLFDKEGRHRSKREHCKGCSSTRSIPKTAQDLFDNEDGRSCAAARDHSECHTKESSFGWDIHGTTVKKKCLPTRVRVPPLDIPGNKSTGAEIPSSFDMQHASMHNAHRNAYNNEHWEDDGALRNRIEDDEQLLRKKKKKKHKQKQEWASNVMRRKNRVLNKRQAEREDITKSQNDIMKTLHSLKANMGYLLGLQERSRSKHLDTS